MNEQEQLIEQVCEDVKQLLLRKNRDYGNSFAIQYGKYGVISSLIRMDDKMSRLNNLVNGHQAQVKDESIYDTIQDLAGYALLTLAEMKKIND